MTGVMGASGFDRTFVYILLGGMLLDRSTKLLADATLKGQPTISLLDGYVDLHYAHNSGAMFGALDQLPLVLRFLATRIVPGMLALILVGAYLRTPMHSTVLRVALVTMLTGTVANLVDRFKHDGVVDFINLRLGHQSPWLTINFADIFIGVGVLLLVWHLVVDASRSTLPSENP